MRHRSLAALALCSVVGALGILPGGCNSDGELVVIVRSEIAIDGVAYEILRDGALIERRCTLLGETSSGGLPGSISVTGAAGTSVTLRIVGLVGSTCDQSAGFDPSQLGDLAVLREIVTTIPEGRSATLNVLFKKSCGRADGVIVADGVGEFDDTSCAAGTTCIDAPDGSCESSTVDSSTLDDYQEGDLGGGGSGVIGGNGAGGNGATGGMGGMGGAGGGGGTPGVCQMTNVASGVRNVTALPAQTDAIYFADTTGVTRWEPSGSKDVPFAGDSNAIFDLAAAAAGSNELLVIGDGTAVPTVKTVTFDGGAFGAGLQQGLGVTNVAAAALMDGIAPLWTEDDPMGEAAHWVKPPQMAATPLGASLGGGQLIEAAGNFAAVAYTNDAAMNKLDIIDLSSCTAFCAPVETIDTVVSSLAVGSGAIAWIDDTSALQQFSLSTKTVNGLGSGHKLVAASMDGPTAIVDGANVLRLRSNGFDGAEACSISLGINPLMLVRTKDAAYVLVDGQELRRYSVGP